MENRVRYFHIPMFLFWGIWTVILFLYQFSKSQFFPIRPYTFIILYSSLLATTAGYYWPLLFSKKKEQLFSKLYDISIDYDKLCVLFIILFVLVSAFSAYYIKVLTDERGGLVRYFANPVLSRMLVVNISKFKKWDLLLSLSTYGVNLNKLLLLLTGVLYSSSKLRHKLLSILPLLVGIILSLVTFSRYSLISTILIWIFSIILFSFWLETRRRKRILKEVLLLVLIFSGLFLFISYVILSLRLFTKTDQEILSIFMKQLNYYLVGNVVSLDIFLHGNYNLLFGASVFRSVLKWIARLGFIEKDIVLGTHYEFVRIGASQFSNTYSYLRVFIEDFGVIGQAFFSLLWGGVSFELIKWQFKKFGVIRLYLGTIVMTSFFMSFFGFYWVAIAPIVLDMLLFGIVLMIFRKLLIINCHTYAT